MMNVGCQVSYAHFSIDHFPVGEYMDAGTAFYATDFWSLWDIGIVAIGLAFFIARERSLVLCHHGRTN